MAKILAFSAKTNRELGRKMGAHFRAAISRKLRAAKRTSGWEGETRHGEAYLRDTIRFFPRYVEELRGYAEAARVPFDELWTLSLEIGEDLERCTTVVSKGGRFLGHNEDFEPASVKDIFLVRKELPHVRVHELLYFHTLGGNSCGVNSHGVVFSTNTVHAGWAQRGVPRNVIARWLSESKDPLKDCARLRKLPRSDGYSFTFLTPRGSAVNVEYSRKGVRSRQVPSPFVHTNHFLTDLVSDEMYRSEGSETRFTFAKAHAAGLHELADMKRLLADDSKGRVLSLRNEDTIARLVFDREHGMMYALLKGQPIPVYQKIPFPKSTE